MLTAERIEEILARLPGLTLGVVGDLFLDQYLHLDGRLTEPSLETGLDAYQVVDIVNSPGAAGTVINNLVALGVGRVKVLSFLGTEGRGYDLKQELLRRGVDVTDLLETPRRRTPTYTKPMLFSRDTAAERSAGASRLNWGEELNRFDIKNRTPTPTEVEQYVINRLLRVWNTVDALLVLDQVSEPECGVVTTRVREVLAKLGEQDPRKLLLADSREHIGLFKNCWTKPNATECQRATGDGESGLSRGDLESEVLWLANETNRPVFCTVGESGMFLVDPVTPSGAAHSGRSVYQVTKRDDTVAEESFTPVLSPLPTIEKIPAYPVAGPIDIVGAGDSTSAGIACAYAAGATLTEAAAFGNLVASITIQQIGTTGTATPAQVRARWQEIMSS